MAVKTTLIDDMDESEGAATHQFSIDGNLYQIDLTDKNFTNLCADLEPYIAVARLQRSTSHKAAKKTAPQTPSRPRQEDIRQWAKKKGIKVSDRGRIRQEVYAQFERENSMPATSRRTAKRKG